jgi:hypothetical protein
MRIPACEESAVALDAANPARTTAAPRTATIWLYRWTGKKGIRVGRDRVLFTFMTGFGPNFSHNAIVLLQAQVYLPDGTIFVEGYGSLPPDGPVTFVLPVVGGTRIYDNVRGHVKVRGARRTLLEFHLTP